MGGFLIGPKIPVIDEQADGSYYGVNMRQFLRMIQALIEANVINMTTANPPATPANGDTYVVAATPTGAWAGQANNIAYWSTDNPTAAAGEWEFWTPLPGWIVGNQADDSAYIFNGTAWVKIGGSAPPVFGTAGEGGFWGPGYVVDDFIADIGATSSPITNVASAVLCYQFALTQAWTLSRCTVYLNTNTPFAGNAFSFGIYNAAGDLLIDSGPFAANSAINTPLTNLFTPVTLPPGIYYFVQSSNLTTLSATGFGGSSSSFSKVYNANGLRTVVATNQYSGLFALPATLGPLTNMAASPVGGYLNPAAVFWEP